MARPTISSVPYISAVSIRHAPRETHFCNGSTPLGIPRCPSLSREPESWYLPVSCTAQAPSFPMYSLRHLLGTLRSTASPWPLEQTPGLVLAQRLPDTRRRRISLQQ